MVFITASVTIAMMATELAAFATIIIAIKL